MARSKARARFYVKVRAVKEAKRAACGLKRIAAAMTLAELAKRPAITTKLGDKPLAGKKLAAELKRRRLVGYALTVRIVRCRHRLNPPAKGKVYKVLMVEVGTALDAEKIPSGQMALAGQGTATVGTEVSRIKPKELAQLRREALTEALRQSVKKFVAKLGKKRRRRRRRRRRSRRK